MRQWLTTVLLKELFSGQSDTTLRQLREAIQGITSFGELLRGGRSISFILEEIDELLDARYATSKGFLILSLLYPTLDYRNLFHMDHIYPKHLFTSARLTRRNIPYNRHQEFLDRYNRIGNIQLLEGPANQEKQGKDFDEWLDNLDMSPSDRVEYMKKHYIPDVDLTLEHFVEMFEAREQLIAHRLNGLFLTGESG